MLDAADAMPNSTDGSRRENRGTARRSTSVVRIRHAPPPGRCDRSAIVDEARAVRGHEHDAPVGREFAEPPGRAQPRGPRPAPMPARRAAAVARRGRAAGGSPVRSPPAAPDRPRVPLPPARARDAGSSSTPARSRARASTAGSAPSSPSRTFDAIVPARSAGACPAHAIDDRSPGSRRRPSSVDAARWRRRSRAARRTGSTCPSRSRR